MKKCKCGCNKWCAAGRVILGVGLFAALGWAVMLLWNRLIPDLLGLGGVTYCQALGLFVLGRLLLGGLKLGGCRCGCNGHHAHKEHLFHEKWARMTPEQRKEFMHKCQCDCGCQDEDTPQE